MGMLRHTALAAVVLSGCAALSDDLQRAEDAYAGAQYEESLVWLASLEKETPGLDPDERARFYFLRGMTAYRLGARDDALYYLALAREAAGDEARGLPSSYHQPLEHTLSALTPEGPTFHARAAIPE